MKRAPSTSLRQLSWCFALVLSLLFSQFSGQRHRIDHTLWQAGISQLQSADAVYKSYNDATHSCIALDAATLADSLAGAIAFLLPALGGAVALPAFACALRARSFDAWFRSRAPPSLP